MNDQLPPPVVATPDGGAELRLVLRLDWADVAELGRLAGELAGSVQRPVSLDEAASHRLSSRPVPVVPARTEGATATGTTVEHVPGALPAGVPAEPPRPAIAAAANSNTPPPLTGATGSGPRPAAAGSGNQPSVRPIQPVAEEKSRQPLAAAG